MERSSEMMQEASKPGSVELKNVSFSYKEGLVLEDVNISIQPGEFVCFVGPNGGGKTTLMKLIIGLLTPDTGTVSVIGMSPLKARPLIGYVPQHAHHDLMFPVTVWDVVLMGRIDNHYRFGAFTSFDRKQAELALQEVDLLHLKKRPFSALSGGQRQRTLIARALVSEPSVMILDEPMTNIDALREKELVELLKTLSERMTILMVTHDLGFVSKYVSKVVCVNRKAVIHPTTEMTGDLINLMYDHSVSMIRHDRKMDQGASR